jgi:hypothetical protein
MRFAFIQTRARIWRITMTCSMLKVSRAGYYAWRVRPLYERVKTDHLLTEKTEGIHDDVQRHYGSPRVRRKLEAPLPIRSRWYQISSHASSIWRTVLSNTCESQISRTSQRAKADYGPQLSSDCEGWTLSTRLTQELTLSVLRMALLYRSTRTMVHHSDRGGVFSSLFDPSAFTD